MICSVCKEREAWHAFAWKQHGSIWFTLCCVCLKVLEEQEEGHEIKTLSVHPKGIA